MDNVGIIRLVVALAVGLVLTFVCCGAALADQGPHNSQHSKLGLTDYSGSGCQVCHAAHREEAAYLLRGGLTMYEFCTTCHGGSGLARTNVVDGEFLSGSGLWNTPDEYGADDTAAVIPAYTKQLNGGRYENGANSWHRVRADEETTERVQYGLHATDAEDAANPVTDFKCTSCHDPHGKQLSEVASSVLAQTNGRTDNYRLLRTVPVYSWEDTDTTGNFDPEADKSYTKQALKNETRSEGGMSKFCASCHVDYMTSDPADAAGDPNAPGGVRYVHRELQSGSWKLEVIACGSSDDRRPPEHCSRVAFCCADGKNVVPNGGPGNP